MEAAAVVLAGGKSTRFRGNKALARLASQRLIDRLVDTLRGVFPRVFVVAAAAEEYRDLGVEVVADLFPGRGPIAGIHAGLVASPWPTNFFVACDMPFVNGALARYLVEQAGEGIDAVVPVVGGYPEPLCAVYCKSCLAPITSLLEKGVSKVTSFYPSVRVRYVGEEELVPFGVARCFFNVNTKSDLKKARQLLAETRRG